MATIRLPRAIKDQISKAVAHYESRIPDFRLLAATLLPNFLETPALAKLIHSTKVRTKDPTHLERKLNKKAHEALALHKPFRITQANLFTEIEDLAGIRILHLHTRQMEQIHPLIVEVLAEHRYTLVGTPVAYIWDKDNELFFKNLGFKISYKPTNYTSLHYIIKANRKTDLRCELQVRSLAEELWGEVSHTIDYPCETKSIACREQLKALARVASGCTRLVDSLFASHAEYRRLSSRKTR